jgi:phytanoyl-CoA hydroxylase
MRRVTGLNTVMACSALPRERAPRYKALMRQLQPDDLSFFEREGYLIVEDLFRHEELQPLIDEITCEIDRLADTLVQSGELSRTYREEPFETRLVSIHAETPLVQAKIRSSNLCGPEVFGLITHPGLLDLAEQLCGPEIVASSVYRLRLKLPGERASCVPWHQDSCYFEPACDHALILIVWIPLVDATRERGCLWVLPRAHQQGLFPHAMHAGNVFLEIGREQLPPVRPVCMPVRKGGLVLMTNTTPHCSLEVNRSNVIRWNIDIRYQGSDLPTNAFARADDAMASALEDPVHPVACVPPDRDFLVRSRARPADVCRTAEEFQELRQRRPHGRLTSRWSPRDRWTTASSSSGT